MFSVIYLLFIYLLHLFIYSFIYLLFSTHCGKLFTYLISFNLQLLFVLQKTEVQKDETTCPNHSQAVAGQGFRYGLALLLASVLTTAGFCFSFIMLIWKVLTELIYINKFLTVRQVYSCHNKDLKWQTLRPSACHSSWVLDRRCYGSHVSNRQCYSS